MTYIQKLVQENTLLLSELEDFGLTKNESIIYLYLLKIGQSRGVSKISLGTGIHRQYIYVSLNTLLDKGLVSEQKHGERNKYIAEAPGAIIKLARRKMDRTNDLVSGLEKVSKLGNEQAFEIYEGDEQIRQFERDFVESLPEDEVQYLIGGGTEAFMKFHGEEYYEFSKIQTKKRLTTYFIGSEDEVEHLKIARDANKGYFHLRILPGMKAGITGTTIRLNSVTLYSMSKPPLFYIIKSKLAYEEYKRNFDVLWNLAKEV